MKKPKPITRCKYCPKVLRGYNQSGICSSCRNTKKFILISEEVTKHVKRMV